MLTQVKAYSSWRSAPELSLDDGRAETDLIQIRNIDGLDPVKASINTSPHGSIDGASYVGSSVENRNIVLTLHPNPDWDNHTYESLRRLLYSYFMPKLLTKLIFYSDDIDPVQIVGYVEDVQVNMFSKDPELIVSIICPDPYFTSVNPTVITGRTIAGRVNTPITIPYNGNVENGIQLKVSTTSAGPTWIAVQIGSPAVTYFVVDGTVNSSKYFEMSSIPMRKYVQNIDINSGVITNLLSKAHIEEGSDWPVFQPGDNEFAVYTSSGDEDYELTFFERYGGL